MIMYDTIVERLHLSCAAMQMWLPCVPQYAEKINLLKDAADAIEELQKAVNFHKFNSEFWEDKYNSLADEKWIPCSERLPERETNVIANTKDCGVCEAVFYDENHWLDPVEVYANYGTVTHWMPLPEPPKEE